MSTKELQRVEVLARVASGELKLGDSAVLLGVSYRQAKRLHRRYREEGASGLRHRGAGRSNRSQPAELRRQVLELVREKYSGSEDQRFGPTLAAEHLAQEDGIAVHPETLRRWMLAEALWGRRRGKWREHRRRRPAKEHFGELVQLDGSFHGWFEQRGPRGCLMNMVDDATGVTHAWIGEAESIWAAVHVLRGWIEKYGAPLALYTDWKNVYKIAPTAQQELRGEVPQTEFGRMCALLGIHILTANSPEAKGRVERKNGVHQDRLIKKMRRKGIADYAAANAYLEEYLLDANTRFGRVPADPRNYHRATPSKEVLDAVFRLESKRAISNDWVVRYNGRYLQLLPPSRRYVPRKGSVLVYENEAGELEVHYRGQPIAHQEIPAPVKVKADKPYSPIHVRSWRPKHRHGPEHPYKRGTEQRIKEQRLDRLKQAVAARAAARACATPNRAAVPAAPGSAPALAASPISGLPSDQSGDISNVLSQGTFLTRFDTM
jgi:transposase